MSTDVFSMNLLGMSIYIFILILLGFEALTIMPFPEDFVYGFFALVDSILHCYTLIDELN